MSQITRSQVEKAYELAKAFYLEQVTQAEAVAELQTIGMNPSSAKDYIRNLRQMLRGEEFQRTLNLPATDFYLHSIRRDFGEAAYANALQSLEHHLDYYEGLTTGAPQPGQRQLLKQHRLALSTLDLDSFQSRLEEEVQSSMRLSAAERTKRLIAASAVPGRTVATVKVFIRNADVIAAVLLRANGRCENCGGEAPFRRKSDGSPYLEVHHKKRLADGGEDTVENAIAVCPNCHRFAHYG